MHVTNFVALLLFCSIFIIIIFKREVLHEFYCGFSPNAELTQNSPNTELIPQTLHKNVLPANARLNLFTLVFKTYNIFYYTFYFEKYLFD